MNQQQIEASQYQISTQLGLYCDQHPRELLTNFCTHPQCFKALCPDCIDSHTKFHKSANSHSEIDSIKNVKQKCSKKVTSGITELHNILDEVEQQIQQFEQEDQQLINIRNAKESLMIMINQHFADLEARYQQMNQQNIEPKQEQLNKLLEQLATNLNELEYLNANLESNALNSIDKICFLDLKKIIEKNRKQWRSVQNYINSNNVKAISDDQQLNQINIALKKYVQIEKQTQQIQPQSQVSYSYQQKGHSNVFSIHQSSDQQNNQVLFPVEENKQVQSMYNPVPVQENNDDSYLAKSNFFNQKCKQQYLHFFQQGTNILHLFDLFNHSWSKILLQNKNQFVIPLFSKSVTSPNGDIYLSGGSSPDGKKSNVIYKVNWERWVLEEIGVMAQCRSSHGLAYFDEGLLIVAGFEDRQIPLSHCEIFYPHFKKTLVLPELQRSVASPAVVSFKKGAIKAGGLCGTFQLSNVIEFLESKSSEWKIVNIASGVFNGKATSAGFQISDNEVLIFGGYYENNQGSNECYCLKMEDDLIYVNETSSLPVAEGFWNQNPINFNGEVYILQNALDEQNESCLEDERKVLKYGNQKWMVL